MTKPVRTLRRGDMLHCGGVVDCVMQIRPVGAHLPLAHMAGGLLLTPWHPVRLPTAAGKQWIHPASLGEDHVKVLDTPCDAVYSFLVRR